MPNAMVSLDYNKCRPDRCNDGYCYAASFCPFNLLQQEEANGFPFAGPAICKGCAKCAAACPFDAITIS